MKIKDQIRLINNNTLSGTDNIINPKLKSSGNLMRRLKLGKKRRSSRYCKMNNYNLEASIVRPVLRTYLMPWPCI